MNLGNVGHMRIALAQMELSAEPQENLGAAKDVIVGAASSGVSLTVIDKITSAGVVQYSPANTAADFTDGFADATDSPSPNSLSRVQIATLASDGALMFDADGAGVNPATMVTLLQFVTIADIAAGKLFFVPSPNENDTTDYATFNFRLESVCDLTDRHLLKQAKRRRRDSHA